MDGRASVASFLLSVVIAVPCMRKLSCLPPDQKLPAPQGIQQPAPQAPPKPGAAAPEKTAKTGHCTVHTSVRGSAHVRTAEHTI